MREIIYKNNKVSKTLTEKENYKNLIYQNGLIQKKKYYVY